MYGQLAVVNHLCAIAKASHVISQKKAIKWLSSDPLSMIRPRGISDQVCESGFHPLKHAWFRRLRLRCAEDELTLWRMDGQEAMSLREGKLTSVKLCESCVHLSL